MLINALSVVAQATGGSQDVTVPSQTPTQFWFAVVFLVAAAAGSLILWYRTDFAGLPGDQSDVKATLKQQRQDASPVSLRIPAPADVADYWDPLSAVIDSVEAGSPDASLGVSDRKQTTQALAEARDEITRAWEPVLGRLPRRARQAIELGILLAVFGAIAVSTSAVVSTLEGGSGMPTLPQLLERAVSLTQAVISFGIDGITAFPFAGTVAQLAFAYGLLTARWFYDHWYVSAALVVLGGLALAVLEWRAEGSDDTVLYERRRTGLNVVGTAVVIWLLGVIPATVGAGLVAVGSATGVPALGSDIALAGAGTGFVFALLATGLLALGAFAGLIQDVLLAAGAGVRFPHLARLRPGILRWRLRNAIFGAPFGDPDLPALDEREPNYALAGSIFLRRLLNAANGVFLVVLLAYVIVSVVDGRLMRVLSALASAPGDTQLAVGLVVLVPVVALAVQARAVWPDLKAALIDSFARQRVRAVVLGRGVPTAGVAAAYLIAYQLFQSIPIALIVAILVGLGLYGLYVLLLKSQHRVSMWGREEPLPSETLVQVYPPLTVELEDEDADGGTREEQRHYAVVNGSTHVMWDDRDEFETFLRETVRDCRDRDETPSSMGVWHAHDAFEDGIVDPEVTEGRVHEEIRKYTIHPLREANGAAKRSDVLEKVEQFPDDRREERWEEWFEMGVLSRVDDLLVLEYDPWRKDKRSS